MLIKFDRAKTIVEQVAPVISKTFDLVDYLSPYIVVCFTSLYNVYSSLTSNGSRVVYGVLISFFGGSFPVVISVRIFQVISISSAHTVPPY